MSDIKLVKYLMLKPKTAIDISPEICDALQQITARNPRLSVNLLIDIALDYISNLKEEDLLKLITDYYGRKHTSSAAM